MIFSIALNIAPNKKTEQPHTQSYEKTNVVLDTTGSAVDLGRVRVEWRKSVAIHGSVMIT